MGTEQFPARRETFFVFCRRTVLKWCMQFTLENFGLPANSPTALKDWYVNVLGADLAYSDGQTPPAYFVRLSGGLLMEINQGTFSLAETGNNRPSGWRHVALRVDSIAEAKAQLEQRGVKFTEPVKPAGAGGHVLFFSDPEGNLLHLVERPADSPLKVPR
jgi:glyoxylase I family protein